MPQCGICFSEKAYCMSCPKCNFNSCTTCIREYFKTQNVPVCPNLDCKLEFTREIISDESTALLKVFKTMREKYLLDIEKARLPEAQVYTEMIRYHQNFSSTIPILNERLRELETEAGQIRRQIQYHNTVMTLVDDKYFEDALYHHTHSFLAAEHGYTTKKKVVRETINILSPCSGEKCRGYIVVDKINTKRGKCGTCGLTVCRTCMIAINEGNEHNCNQDDVATVTEVRKNSRPCPKCAAPISKIDGCDQMWCVVCHTAFSWTTGELAKGAVHNPHFFAYQRELAKGGDIPRVEGDRVNDETVRDCGNGFFNIPEGHLSTLRHSVRFKELYKFYGDDVDYIESYIQLSLHFQHTMYGLITRRVAPDNIDLRVGFLCNEFDEEHFARVIQQRDKKYHKELEVDAVLLILFDSGNRVVVTLNGTSEVRNSVYTQLKNLIEMSNNRLEQISKIYKNKVKKIVYEYDSVVGKRGLKFE